MVNTIKYQFVKRGHEKTPVENQIQKVEKINKSVLLAEQNKRKALCLTLSVTYNRTLSNIKKTLQPHWHLLKIDLTLEDTFQQTPVIAFRRNQNLIGQMVECSFKK